MPGCIRSSGETKEMAVCMRSSGKKEDMATGMEVLW